MATWSKANKRGSLRASYHTAREMFDWFDSPLATQVERDRLVDAIAHAAWRGRVDRDALVQAIRRVYDPEGAGRGVGPAQLLPESYALMIEARIVGIRDLAGVPDDGFRFGRDTIRAALEQYAQMQPIIAADPVLARVIEEPTLEHRMNNACRDLAGSIGILLMAGNRLLVSVEEKEAPSSAH